MPPTSQQRRLTPMQKVLIYGAIILALPVGFVIWLVSPTADSGQTAAAQTSLDQAGESRSASKQTIQRAKGSAEKPASEPDATDAKSVVGVDAKQAHTPEAAEPSYERLIIGKWETDRDGKRILTVSDDGTAVIDAEIQGFFKQKLFGKRMRIDLRWEIRDDQCYMRCTGGDPGWAINAFTKLYGTERLQPILNLNEKQLLLKDDADDPDHDYKRISAYALEAK